MPHDPARSNRFLELHRPGRPLLMPNAYDVGSAKLLEAAGFDALATTSSGFAATRGALDGGVTVDDVLRHSEELAAGVDIPISADFEDGFTDAPAGIAENVARAMNTGLAGCSIEDFTRNEDAPIYEPELAAERVAAACEVAHGGGAGFVITARAENYLHGHRDLDDTIARLTAYAAAGADALFAPGVQSSEEIAALVKSVDGPVSVLGLPGTPDVAELSSLGVARVSVGGAFAFVAYGAMLDAAIELRDRGTYDYWHLASRGSTAARETFDRPSP